MLTNRVKNELDLLERHVIILNDVLHKGPIGIVRLSEETGIPSHKVRYSLRVLEQEQLIAPSTHGAVATANAKKFMDQFGPSMEQLLQKIESIRGIRKLNLDPKP